MRGELQKRQWIIFDGDVDPEWVENLNSVLDDNKLLTLPNGERLSLPPNVMLLFFLHDVYMLSYKLVVAFTLMGTSAVPLSHHKQSNTDVR